MKRNLLFTLLITGGLLAAAEKDKEKAVAGDPLTTSRTVAYHEPDIIPLNAQINYSTMLVFSKDEKILQGVCGDGDRWQLEHAENVAILKPESSARGASTNINILMASGNVYSFVVHEISNTAGAQADLKLFVNPGDDKLLNASKTELFVKAETAEQYKREADEATAQLRAEQAKEKEKIAEAQNTAQHIRHPYKINVNKKAARVFNVKSIYTLNGLTYIEAQPQEAPAVYEVKDGKPSLIEAPFSNGLYVAPKVIDQGYLKIGKQKLDFKREDPS